MKKLIALSLIMAGMVLMAGFSTLAQAQSPANDLKPTFISPTPGLYVNGWPAFTVSYPKEWVEVPLGGIVVFAVGGIRPDLPPGVYAPWLEISVTSNPLPLEDWAKYYMPFLLQLFRDIKVLSDKPSQLKDGTPAREVEWEGVPKYDPAGGSLKNAPPKISYFMLMARRELAYVAIHLIDDKKNRRGLEKDCLFSHLSAGQGGAGESAP